MASREAERSLPGNIAELTHHTIDLLRKEMKLAKVEVGEKLDQLRQGIMSLAIGWLIFAGGLLTLLAAAVLGIGLYIPYWASALIVGGVVTLIGGAMLGKGRHDVRPQNLEPERALDELQRDKRLIQEHA
jgi:uncharacterized membrane protein YqjE